MRTLFMQCIFIVSEFIMTAFSLLLMLIVIKLGENIFTWSFSPGKPISFNVLRNHLLKYAILLLKFYNQKNLFFLSLQLRLKNIGKKALKSRFSCKLSKNFCLGVLTSVILVLLQEIKTMKQANTAFIWHQTEGH